MKYLITGGTGTLGKEITKKLLFMDQDAEIICFSRDELKQKKMNAEFKDYKLKFVIGDVRDREALIKASVGVDTIFHFAALKHVDVCEANIEESIKTNLHGSLNVIEAAEANMVKNCILSSTDKAVDPINVYGMCKGLAEKAFLSKQRLCGPVNYKVYRWGNVLGSRGSVIHLFAESLSRDQKINITDVEMSRFWISIEEAVDFMCETYQKPTFVPGEVMIPPDIKSCDLLLIADAVSKELGFEDYNISQIGIRPGEKMAEVLISEHEKPGVNSDCHNVMKIDQVIKMVRPIVNQFKLSEIKQCLS